MRHLTILSMIIIITGCSKSQPNTSVLGGNWRLEMISGGFAGETRVYGKDKNITLQLRKDSSYSQRLNGFQTEAGSYFIRTMPPLSGYDTSISFVSHEDTIWRVLSRRQGKMILWDGYMDGYFYTYTKISD